MLFEVTVRRRIMRIGCKSLQCRPRHPFCLQLREQLATALRAAG